MKSNKNTTTCKNKFLSLMNKKGWLVNSLVIIAVISVTLFVLIACWTEMPLEITILWLIISPIALAGTVITIFNGMYISKKGTIVFIPDLRIK